MAAVGIDKGNYLYHFGAVSHILMYIVTVVTTILLSGPLALATNNRRSSTQPLCFKVDNKTVASSSRPGKFSVLGCCNKHYS